MAESFDPTDSPNFDPGDITAMLMSKLGQPGQPPAAAPAPEPPAMPVAPAATVTAPAPAPAQPVQPAQPAAAVPAPAPAPAPAKPAVDPSALAGRYGKKDPAAAPERPPSVDTLPETPPEGDKAGHTWAALRSAAKRFEKEIVPALERDKAAEAAARKEAEDKVAAILAEKERLAQEKDQLLEKVGQLSLTESPKFKEKYGTREAEIRAKLAKTLAQTQRAEPGQADALAGKLLALASDPAALAQALDDLHPRAVGAVDFAVQEWAALDQERRQELADWRQTGLASGIEASREAVIQSAEERRRLSESAIGFARRAGNPVLTADAADPESAARVAEIESAFHGFMQSASQDQLSQAAAEGFVAPFLYARITEQDGEIASLQEQLRSFRDARRPPSSVWTQAAPQPPAPPAASAASRPAVDPDDPSALLDRHLRAIVPQPQ